MFGVELMSTVSIKTCGNNFEREDNMSNATQRKYTSYSFTTDGSLALSPQSHTFVVISGNITKPACVSSRYQGRVRNGQEGKRSDRIGPVSIAVLALAIVASVVIGSFGIQVAEASRISHAFEDVKVSKVAAKQGSSIWSYAEMCKVKGVSTKEIADWILSKNDVGVNGLVPGTEIVLPNYQA